MREHLQQLRTITDSRNACVRAIVTAVLATCFLTACGSKSSAPTQPIKQTVPTDPVVPLPSLPTGADVLASASFDDDTYGALIDDTPGHNSIIDDPTGGGHGKILNINYSTSSDASDADLNQYVSFQPDTGLGAASSVFFRGYVEFPPNTNLSNGDVLRKLTYWRTDRPQNTQCDFVLFMFGNTMGVSVARPTHTTTAYSVYAFTPGQWYLLEIQATMNSKPGSSDGIVRVWVNNALVYQKTNESFTEPTDPPTTRWYWLTAGHQREGASGETSINENRYWDQIAFTTKRIGSF
ncbi:MAG TPA: hypothetical protein VGM50_21485 [Gemmatimonadaceae bacterium]|jgi:hypothetical protein